jgi:hypothetical protein
MKAFRSAGTQCSGNMITAAASRRRSPRPSTTTAGGCRIIGFDVRLDAYGRRDAPSVLHQHGRLAGKGEIPLRLARTSVSRRDHDNQRRWLKDRLERSDAPIKIVFGHHPIYSVRTQAVITAWPISMRCCSIMA